MLQVTGLRFSYPNMETLRDVSFTLERGVGCLLGPNGAGKSTLLKCMAGVLRPRAGRAFLDGVDLFALAPRDVARLVSYSPQEFNMAFPYTVFDVVLMGRNPHVSPLKGPGEEDEELAWRALRELGMANLAEKPFTSLSGGQKRLVLLARSIAQGGKLFLFDEPTSFLDFKNQHVVLSAIRELGGERLVLVSLHDPNQAMTFCDMVFLIKNGSIMVSGEPEKTLTPDNLLRLYDMPVEVVEVMGKRIILPELSGNALQQTIPLTESVISSRVKALGGD